MKIKLGGDGEDEDRIRAVRAARRDVWLGVDANRGLTPDRLERLLPALADAEVQLVEQPFPVGEDAQLAGFDLPAPLPPTRASRRSPTSTGSPASTRSSTSSSTSAGA
ncbi:enolase C-terminal domain-like protein [Rhizorhabdus histidinilytica]